MANETLNGQCLVLEYDAHNFCFQFPLYIVGNEFLT